MSINLNDTRIMLAALEQSYPPQTLLRDTFFPNMVTSASELIDIEYKKGGRRLAPFISSGGGVNVERTGSEVKSYKPPMMAPKRPTTVQNINQRAFGEPVYSSVSPEQRAAFLRATDLKELREMCTRRMEWMCAQLLVFGTFNVVGYSDDGKTSKTDTVTLDWTQKDTLTDTDTWDHAAADIYGNLQDASQTVSRNSGSTPEIGICSNKTGRYLLDNTAIKDWLLRPRENISLMSIAPRIVQPGITRIGIIESINLEIYAYDGIYVDDSGATQQFIPDDYFIMGVPGRGRQMFGAVTQLEQDQVWRSYQGAYVPKVWGDVGSDVQEVRVASRGIPVPEFIDDWYTLKVK